MTGEISGRRALVAASEISNLPAMCDAMLLVCSELLLSTVRNRILPGSHWNDQMGNFPEKATSPSEKFVFKRSINANSRSNIHPSAQLAYLSNKTLRIRLLASTFQCCSLDTSASSCSGQRPLPHDFSEFVSINLCADSLSIPDEHEVQKDN